MMTDAMREFADAWLDLEAANWLNTATVHHRTRVYMARSRVSAAEQRAVISMFGRR